MPIGDEGLFLDNPAARVYVNVLAYMSPFFYDRVVSPNDCPNSSTHRDEIISGHTPKTHLILRTIHRTPENGCLHILVDRHLKEWNPIPLTLTEHCPADSLKVGGFRNLRLCPQEQSTGFAHSDGPLLLN
jgi:hypothetical protein